MTRRLSDGILTAFCKYTEDTEIPDIFSLWVGVSSVAAVLGRDCFLDFGPFVIYPNLYIVLVAGSAKCRKSSAIGIGATLLGRMSPGVRILSQKMTPEHLIGALSGMAAKDETSIVTEAEGIVIVDELSTLIDRNAFKSGLIPILTKLYDSEDFEYGTVGRGIEHVKNPCLSILGGSTMAWIKEAIPAVAIGGGFTSRVVFVFRDKMERAVPWPNLTRENKKRSDDIVHDLNEVAKMRGAFGLTTNARTSYDAEYHRFRESSDFFNMPNLSGYAGRRHTTLLKVSMIVSAARTDSRLVDIKDVGTAINIMRNVETDMPKVLHAISREFIGDVGEEVLTIIKNKGVIRRSDLVKAVRHKLSVRGLDEVLEVFAEMKAVKTEFEAGVVRYIYVGDK